MTLNTRRLATFVVLVAAHDARERAAPCFAADGQFRPEEKPRIAQLPRAGKCEPAAEESRFPPACISPYE